VRHGWLSAVGVSAEGEADTGNNRYIGPIIVNEA